MSASDVPPTTPMPIETLPLSEQRFLGLVLDYEVDGTPFWEMIELLGWEGVRLVNLNSGNYSELHRHLTHWLPVPPTP